MRLMSCNTKVANVTEHVTEPHVTELHMLLNCRDNKSISPTCSWRNYIKSETTLRRGVAKQPSNVKGEKL